MVVSVLAASCADTGGDPPAPTGGAAGTGGTGGTNPNGGASGSSTGGVSTGGVSTGGVSTGGGVTGGSPATGGTSGAATGGTDVGGAGTGGAATGGAATGGSDVGGAGTGGSAPGGAGAGGAPTGGGAGKGGAGSGGTGGVVNMTMGPCDIYAAASPATPCVAAYSTTRRLMSTYTGPLYQVRKGGMRTGTGGTTQDIGIIAGGFADGPAQDTFCGTETCTISKLYDQSGRANHLTVAPAGCYTGTASEADYESNAKGKTFNISGHKVYGLFMNPHDGYRNNTGTGMPTGTQAQGVYELADGKRIGPACCFDFGNASKNNCYGPTGSMDAIYFGTGFWGSGQGTTGPWFMGDFEAGVWATGSGASNAKNNNLPASGVDFAFGILKTSTSGTPQYAIRVGNGQMGTLTTAYDGQAPATWQHKGGIVLGIGGDNSNSSFGTFYEGAVTAGRPSDPTDAAVLANVQAAGYGR
jgi:hypothetical protein